MDILICKQGLFGGTDKLLERLYEWLIQNGYSADSFCSKEKETNLLKISYDLMVLPSSQIGDICMLMEKGIQIKRILVWIMGMGAFSDSYYTYPPKDCFDRALCKAYQKEAAGTLSWLIRNNAIIFTDGVGIYNTVKTSNISSSAELQKNIVPIAIRCPRQNQWKESHVGKKDDIIRISWVGRVSKDFKEIPILHLIEDVERYSQKEGVNIELTIVGDGDAMASVKQKSEEASFCTNFIDNIAYDSLNSFFVEQVDLLVAMGTSALDGAKVGCPTIVVTPVRPNDPERVEYRWIFDSVGYSLGEFPNIDMETGQPRMSFDKIIADYVLDKEVSNKCFEYAQEFDINAVFEGLLKRELPKQLDGEMVRHAETFRNMKKRKSLVKRLLRRERRGKINDFTK